MNLPCTQTKCEIATAIGIAIASTRSRIIFIFSAKKTIIITKLLAQEKTLSLKILEFVQTMNSYLWNDDVEDRQSTPN